MKIAVIDYGMGNLHSIAKALEHVSDGPKIYLAESAAELATADKVVFPGVGSIGHCMDELRQRGLDDVIRRLAESKPLLGICLGMQALFDFSEENGGTECLGVIPGKVCHFSRDEAANQQNLKIPHMGWSQVRHEIESPMWSGIDDDARFYFVHSYYVQPDEQAVVAGSTDYIQRFCSSVAREHLFATQFHPEKSQKAGLQLLRNFVMAG